MKSPFQILDIPSIGKACANGLHAAPSLVAFIALHLTALVLVAALSHLTTLTVPNLIPVMLLEAPQQQQEETPARPIIIYRFRLQR